VSSTAVIAVNAPWRAAWRLSGGGGAVVTTLALYPCFALWLCTALRCMPAACAQLCNRTPPPFLQLPQLHGLCALLPSLRWFHCAACAAGWSGVLKVCGSSDRHSPSYPPLRTAAQACSPAPDSETWNQSCDRPDYNSAAGALTHARDHGGSQHSRILNDIRQHGEGTVVLRIAPIPG
jgi:hypothetical protein